MARMIEFFHECVPPTTTAQQRQWFGMGNNGRRLTALTPAAKLAKATLTAIVEKNAPERPLQGALAARVAWTWPHTRETRRNAESRGLMAVPKATRPDTHNLSKALYDAMTAAGYWDDDAQVAVERIEKHHGDIPGIYVHVAEINTNQEDER